MRYAFLVLLAAIGLLYAGADDPSRAQFINAIVSDAPQHTSSCGSSTNVTNDGTSAKGHQFGASATTVATSTTTLTGSTSPDDAMAWVFTNRTVGQGTPSSSVTSISDGTNSYTKVSSWDDAHVTTANFTHMELWHFRYGTHPSAVTVTANLNPVADNAVIIVDIFAGVSGTTTFDPNVSLPAASAWVGSTAAQPSVSGVSTTNAHTMLIAGTITSFTTGDPAQTAGTGFTLGADYTETGGSQLVHGATEYKQLTATVSSQTYTFGVNWSNQIMVVHALSGA